MRLFSLSVAKFTNRIMRGSAQMMALPLDFLRNEREKIMLGQKLLDNSRMHMSDDAAQQYLVVKEEITKLCNLTHMGWSLTGNELFDAVRKVSFVEGAVFGAALLGLVISIRKIGKTKPTSNEG